MRFYNDFEPGKRTVPSIFFIGFSVSCSTAAPADARVCAREVRRLGRRDATECASASDARAVAALAMVRLTDVRELETMRAFVTCDARTTERDDVGGGRGEDML